MPTVFWTKAWTILKSYGVIIGAITVISTTAVKIDRKRQHDSNLEKDLNELMDTTNHYFKAINYKLNSIEQGINTLNEKVDKQGTAIENTQKSFKTYMLRDKTLSAEEFYKYMESLQYENEKKN